MTVDQLRLRVRDDIRIRSTLQRFGNQPVPVEDEIVQVPTAPTSASSRAAASCARSPKWAWKRAKR